VSPVALGLVIGAAVIHAGWNALAKRAGDPLAFLWCAGGVGTLLYLPGVLYVLSATGFPRGALPFVVATVVLHSAYFFTLGRAYRSGDLSVVYPVARGLGVALVPVLAFAIFDERLSPVGTLGVALVVLGIFSLHWRRRWSAGPLLAPGTGWAHSSNRSTWAPSAPARTAGVPLPRRAVSDERRTDSLPRAIASWPAAT